MGVEEEEDEMGDEEDCKGKGERGEDRILGRGRKDRREEYNIEYKNNINKYIII